MVIIHTVFDVNASAGAKASRMHYTVEANLALHSADCRERFEAAYLVNYIIGILALDNDKNARLLL